MSRLSDDQRNQVLDIIMKELKDKDHRSFQQLCGAVNRGLGLPQDNNSPGYPGTDYALQALRRRGSIEWFRFGTYKLWKIKGI
jgi:hypothetical protein